jgi:hypothetical protein
MRLKFISHPLRTLNPLIVKHLQKCSMVFTSYWIEDAVAEQTVSTNLSTCSQNIIGGLPARNVRPSPGPPESPSLRPRISGYLISFPSCCFPRFGDVFNPGTPSSRRDRPLQHPCKAASTGLRQPNLPHPSARVESFHPQDLSPFRPRRAPEEQWPCWLRLRNWPFRPGSSPLTGAAVSGRKFISLVPAWRCAKVRTFVIA